MPALGVRQTVAPSASAAMRSERVETPWAIALDDIARRIGGETQADRLRALRRSHPDLPLAQRLALAVAQR